MPHNVTIEGNLAKRPIVDGDHPIGDRKDLIEITRIENDRGPA